MEQHHAGVLHGAHTIDPGLTLDSHGESSARLYTEISSQQISFISGYLVSAALAVFIVYMLVRFKYAVAGELEVFSVNQTIRFLALNFPGSILYISVEAFPYQLTTETEETYQGSVWGVVFRPSLLNTPNSTLPCLWLPFSRQTPPIASPSLSSFQIALGGCCVLACA